MILLCRPRTTALDCLSVHSQSAVMLPGVTARNNYRSGWSCDLFVLYPLVEWRHRRSCFSMFLHAAHECFIFIIKCRVYCVYIEMILLHWMWSLFNDRRVIYNIHRSSTTKIRIANSQWCEEREVWPVVSTKGGYWTVYAKQSTRRRCRVQIVQNVQMLRWSHSIATAYHGSISVQLNCNVT